MSAEIIHDIQLVEAFEDMPAEARGTALDTHPAAESYQIEFYEPVRCVRTVPMAGVWQWTAPVRTARTDQVHYAVTAGLVRSNGRLISLSRGTGMTAGQSRPACQG